MKKRLRFFFIFLFTAACSTFSQKELEESLLNRYYAPPVITISPDPSGFINALSLTPNIEISNVGGLGAVILDVDGTVQRYEANGATSFHLSPNLRTTVSRGIPLKVSAYSSKTGSSSQKNVTYLFDVAGMGDPPSITVSSPAAGTLLAAGSVVSLTGSVFHSVSKVQQVDFDGSGNPIRTYALSAPYPGNFPFNELYTMPAVSGTFTMAIAAVSGGGVAIRKNLSWQVVDAPIIDSISPTAAATTITTTITNFTVVVRSPSANTSVKLYWDGTLKNTLTTDGSGAPLVFSNVSIPLRSTPIGTSTLRVEATYPGGNTTAQNHTYNVDHTAAKTPPAIVSISPDPAIPLLTGSVFNEIQVSQSYPGIKSVLLSRLTPPTVAGTPTNLPATPPTTLVLRQENIPLGNYSGLHEFRITAVSHSDLTNISNFTYVLSGPTNLILVPSSSQISNREFMFNVSDRMDVSYVLISTNAGAGAWRHVAAYSPNSPNFSRTLTLVLPYNSSMGLRVASVNSNKIITTNTEISNYAVQPGFFIASNSPATSRSIPESGNVPFVALIHGPDPIHTVDLRVNGSVVFFRSGIIGSTTSYTISNQLSGALVSGDNNIDVYINGSPTPIYGSPITYKALPKGSATFASFPQDKEVVTSTDFRMQIYNWNGSVNIPSSAVSIQKLPSGPIKNNERAINTDSTWTQLAGDSFNLDMGENQFQVTIRAPSAPTLTTNITIYLHNNTNY